MKITEIVRTRSITVKLPDYEATQYFVSAKAEIEGDDDGPQECAARLRVMNDKILLADIERHYRTRGKKISREQLQRRYGIGKIAE